MNSYRNINRETIVHKKNQIKIRIYDNFIKQKIVYLLFINIFKLFCETNFTLFIFIIYMI
jgi:hypothetical protein